LVPPMINAKFNFYGDQALATVKAAGWQRVQRCAVFFWQSCVAAVSRANPRPYHDSSKPGEPPKARTGFGRSQIRYELDEPKGTARVGVALPGIYMLHLDQARDPKRRRPWLVATLERVLPTLRSLAGGG